MKTEQAEQIENVCTSGDSFMCTGIADWNTGTMCRPCAHLAEIYSVMAALAPVGSPRDE